MEKIGRGNYGIVYKTNDKEPKAIKRVLKDENLDFFSSSREIHCQWLLSRHGHPNILGLHRLLCPYNDKGFRIFSPLPGNIGAVDDEYYFLYDYANGGNLFNYIKKTRLTHKQIENISLDILLGLNYMHSIGLVHRDIKPENILIFENEDGLSAKICDFGFTMRMNKFDPHTPKIYTYSYRSPEIIFGLSYSDRADIWAYGCILYDMVTRGSFINVMFDTDREYIQYIISSVPYDIDQEVLDSMNKNNLELKNKSLVKSFSSFIKVDEEFFEGKYEEFKELLISCLSFSDRPSSLELMKLDYFSNQEEKISDTIEYEIPRKVYREKIIECRERDEVIDLILDILKENLLNKNDISWYKNRSIFQTISMFDRILVYLSENQTSEENGEYKFLSSEEVDLYFKVILYFCYKYYSTTDRAYKISDIFGEEFDRDTMIEMDEIDERIPEILNEDTVTDTLYDIYVSNYPINSITDIYSMLLFISTGHNNNKTPYESYQFYLENKEAYDTEADEFIEGEI